MLVLDLIYIGLETLNITIISGIYVWVLVDLGYRGELWLALRSGTSRPVKKRNAASER